MADRYFNTCKTKKPLEQYKKYGHECSDCRKMRYGNQREKFYNNRVKCECGIYISDGNSKEKHEKTKAHQNFLTYGSRNPDGKEFLDFVYEHGLEGNLDTYRRNAIR